MSPRKLKVERITVEGAGTDVQHWRDPDDGTIVIAFGEELDDLARQRAEREILAEYGHRRRAIPIFGHGDPSQDTKSAPLVTAIALGVAITAAAAAAVFIPTALNTDEPTRRPPAAAPPHHLSPTAAPPRAAAPKPSGTQPRTPPSREPPTAAPSSTSGGEVSESVPPVTESGSEAALPDVPDVVLSPVLPTKPPVPAPTDIPDVIPTTLSRCLTVKINETKIRLLCWPPRGGQAQ